MEPTRLFEFIYHQKEKFPLEKAFGRKENGKWIYWSTDDMINQAMKMASGLIDLGLKPGDKWCLCISRWIEAMNDGAAPPIVLESTHQKVLDYVSLKVLRKYEAPSSN